MCTFVSWLDLATWLEDPVCVILNLFAASVVEFYSGSCNILYLASQPVAVRRLCRSFVYGVDFHEL